MLTRCLCTVNEGVIGFNMTKILSKWIKLWPSHEPVFRWTQEHNYTTYRIDHVQVRSILHRKFGVIDSQYDKSFVSGKWVCFMKDDR